MRLAAVVFLSVLLGFVLLGACVVCVLLASTLGLRLRVVRIPCTVAFIWGVVLYPVCGVAMTTVAARE
jgi:hypothetical protein